MDKKRILIVTQELDPYLVETTIGNIVKELVGKTQAGGYDIRILMPRFGSINERRHRLHEVVRLSGINIIIKDDDYPLIIKVASLPGARMQVYFLDNEDFFKRKNSFASDEGELFDDNSARTVFFCRGVLETVKKFGWAPDIIHCHGWITSLVPLFIKTAYKKDPIFENSKVVYSVYDNVFEGPLPSDFVENANINRVKEEDLTTYGEATNDDLHIGAIFYADASIEASANITKEVTDVMEKSGKPILEFPGEEEYQEAYLAFYTTLLEE